MLLVAGLLLEVAKCISAHTRARTREERLNCAHAQLVPNKQSGKIDYKGGSICQKRL